MKDLIENQNAVDEIIEDENVVIEENKDIIKDLIIAEVEEVNVGEDKKKEVEENIDDATNDKIAQWLKELDEIYNMKTESTADVKEESECTGYKQMELIRYLNLLKAENKIQ